MSINSLWYCKDSLVCYSNIKKLLALKTTYVLKTLKIGIYLCMNIDEPKNW